VRVKICGITSVDEALAAQSAGADAIGVVMYSHSKRLVSRERAEEIFAAMGPFTATVAVSHTTDPRELADMLALGPTAVQISFPFPVMEMTGSKVLRVITKGQPLPDDCDAIVIDESQGEGRGFDPAFACDVVQRSQVPIILAGGLTPKNVFEAATLVRPYAVDVASGVETYPGVKDKEKMHAFITACRGV
jgi:phosphoribosylanthranilate isomerase